MKNDPPRRPEVWKSFLLPMLVFLGALILLWLQASACPATPTHGTDEGGFLNAARTLGPAYVQGLSDPGTLLEPIPDYPLGNYGNRNPKLGIYTLAFFRYLQSGTGASISEVQGIRRLMVVVSAGSVVLFFLLIGRAGSPLMAATGAGLFLASPTFRSTSVLALPDPLMLFLVLLALREALNLEAALRERPLPWGPLLRFGLLAGLAVSTRLYALVLAPVLLWVVWSASRNVSIRGLPLLLVPALCVLLLFFGTSPDLLSSPVHGLRMMSSLHIEALVEVNPEPQSAWGHIMTYPFALFGAHPHPATASIPALGMESAFPVGCGYLALLVGGVGALWRRRLQPIVFFVSGFALTAFVATSMGATWCVPKAFLLPSVGLIWVFCAGMAPRRIEAGAPAVKDSSASSLAGAPSPSASPLAS